MIRVDRYIARLYCCYEGHDDEPIEVGDEYYDADDGPVCVYCWSQA